MKNLVGIVPNEYSRKVIKPYSRDWLHAEGGEEDWYHLPRSICDLNMARPIHLAVIDGVKNAIGGEGPWNPSFEPCEDHYLLAGKNSVATDSVASYIMGNDPEPAQLLRPDGTYCDNHLYLANQKGMGTNLMSEIELVGDGAGTITGTPDDQPSVKETQPVKLYQNHPNPFKEGTRISFHVASDTQVTLNIYNAEGKEITKLLDGVFSRGGHMVEFRSDGLPAGIYYAQLNAMGISLVKKMILIK